MTSNPMQHDPRDTLIEDDKFFRFGMTDSPKTTDSEDWPESARAFSEYHDLSESQAAVLQDILRKTRTAARASALREALEVVEEHGHQQDDDTIWCNMDETCAAIERLLDT